VYYYDDDDNDDGDESRMNLLNIPYLNIKTASQYQLQNLRNTVFWDVMPCSLLTFRRTKSPSSSGSKNKSKRNQYEEGSIVCYFLQSGFLLAYSFILEFQEIYSPEKQVDFQRTTWHYNPECRTLPNRCENLKSCTKILNQEGWNFTGLTEEVGGSGSI
jgi:hypothetical protein